jgi:hypothetical protein
MKIEELDRKSLSFLRAEIDKALAPLAEETGLVISAGNASFTPGQATLKINISTVSKDGQVNTREAENFKVLAEVYGLNSDDLGKTFTYGGKRYTICGLKPRCSKPVIAQSEDGRMYRFPADGVKAMLAAAR